MQTEQVIGMEQIFEPAVAQKLGKMFGQDVSIYAEDRCLQLKSKAGDGRFIFGKTTENNFTDYFKQLLDWEHLGVNGDTPRFLHGQTGLESYFSEAGCELGGDDESAVSVTISLIVKEDGTPVQAKIENDIDDIDEDKLLALCSKMPKWMPAYQDGQPVMKDAVFSLSLKKHAYDVVPQMPSFTGGQGALFSYLSQSIKYPKDCEKRGVQGRVICTFVVERDGSISDVRVVKSVDPLLDAEAVRVIRNMPNWQPGMQKGKAVRVKFTIPVTFRLQ
ncbi:MAG: energy transducer TonB [Prevotella sp.]|nr:energy transducer TonB [Prevotella sp.]